MVSRTALVIGCIDGTLPASDRAATALAVKQWSADLCLCVPRGEEVAVRYALGAGVDNVSSVEGCNALVYLVGRGGAGSDGERWAAQLAMTRNARLVLDVLDVNACGNGVRVLRDLGRGACEELVITGPAVLVLTDDAPQQMYVSRYRQASVVPPRLETVDSQSMPWQPVRLRTKTAAFMRRTAGTARDRMLQAFGLRESATKSQGHVVVADAERCADHLLRYLAHHRSKEHHLLAADLNENQSRPGLSEVSDADPRDMPSNLSTGRAPRPMVGPVPRYHRWPRPYRPLMLSSKLLRGPRPYGHAQPLEIRGPFSVSMTKDSKDG